MKQETRVRLLSYVLYRLESATVSCVVNTRQQLQVNNILRRLHIVNLYAVHSLSNYPRPPGIFLGRCCNLATVRF